MPAGLSIREARQSELPLIRQLSVDELPDELNEYERRRIDTVKEVFAKRLEEILSRSGNEIFVAEIEGTPGIAGYVWFGISERPFSDLKVGWIYDILVVPSHRGQGVGEALLSHALKVSRERGFELTGLMVRANNKVAYTLYEKLGFKPEYVVMTRRESDADTVSPKP
jgi:[ribosomal protein S18]-alanine N-acetyltransferase